MKTIPVLSVALALSVSLNVFFVAGKPQKVLEFVEPAPRDQPAAPTCRPATEQSADARGAEMRGLAVGLLASSIISGGKADKQSDLKPVKDAGPVADDTLCRLARKILNDEWHGKRSDISESLKKSINNREENEKALRGEAERFSKTIGLTDSDRKRFEDAYRPLRNSHEERIRSTLSVEPIDMAVVVEEAREIFFSADRLVGEMFGDDAKKAVASSERDGRIIILSIGASMAGIPWEDAVKGF